MSSHIDVPKSIRIDDARLRSWPLPMPSPSGDKEERGHVLVIGGSAEMPGAVILAATAALRAGAGKLVVGTVPEIAGIVATAVPEARVIALPVAEGGAVDVGAARALDAVSRHVSAVLIGPGMQNETRTIAFTRALLPQLHHATVVLDAIAMGAVRTEVDDPIDAPRVVDRAIVVTPHAGEMAHLLDITKGEVIDDAAALCASTSRRFDAVVALKGPKTFIATPRGLLFEHEGGNVGLAVSGSGDTLAGLIVGLAARGATPEQACAWGVALHARAGESLARRYAPLGYLAREIAGEVPAILHTLCSPS